MRLPWIATCFLLGFIIVLDPTHTPAQYGRKGDGGEFGGKRSEFGGKRGEFGGKREFNGKREFSAYAPGGTPGMAYSSRGELPPVAAPSAPPVVLYGAGGTPVDARPTVVYPSGSGTTAYQMTPNPAGFGGPRSFGVSGSPSTYSGERQFNGGGPQGSFGGSGPGGFGGGGPGGGPRGFDPGSMWDRMARGQDSINLNDPEHSRTRSMMERFGTPIPANGILTKEVYMAEAQKRMASMGMPSGGSGAGAPVMMTMSGSMSPDGRMSFTPGGGMGGPGGFGPGGLGGDRGAERLREQDRNNDGRVSRDEADRQLQPNFERIDRDNDGTITLDEYRGYYVAQQSDRDRDRDRDRNREMGSFGGNWAGGWGGGEMGGWGNRQDPRGNPEDARPVAIRFGHLPKDLPDWFHDYDATKDGQIALHEWLKGAKAAGETASVESFAVYDLNGDQLITAEEVQRYDRLQADAKRIAAIQQGESTRPSFAGPGGGRMRVGAGGPGTASPGISQSDKSVASPERGKGNRDSDKPDRKAERKSERNDSDANDRGPAGSNGPWGNAGKKNRN